MLVIGVIALVVIALGWWLGRRQRAVGSPHASLENRLSELTQQARAELPVSQLKALTAELKEILDIERQMVAEGLTRMEARRIGLQGAITSVAGHLELNRILPG